MFREVSDRKDVKRFHGSSVVSQPELGKSGHLLPSIGVSPALRENMVPHSSLTVLLWKIN